MTTSKTMSDIQAELRKRIEYATAESERHNGNHPKSRSAGYLEGYSDALKDAWQVITGDEFSPDPP